MVRTLCNYGYFTFYRLLAIFLGVLFITAWDVLTYVGTFGLFFTFLLFYDSFNDCHRRNALVMPQGDPIITMMKHKNIIHILKKYLNLTVVPKNMSTTETKKLYGILAEFKNPKALIDVSKKVRKLDTINLTLIPFSYTRN